MSELSDTTEHIIKLWRKVESLESRIDKIQNSFIMIQKPQSKEDYAKIFGSLVAIGLGLSHGVIV